MKKYCVSFLFVLLCLISNAQQIIYTKSANIRFYSSTPLENIEAITKEGTSFINTDKGEVIFSLLIKSFRFEKALMEEHFNENYLESDKFPKGSFKGNIINKSEINFAKDGNYTARINGEMTIHGVTKPVNIISALNIKNGKVSGSSSFKIKPADYNIQIPSLVKGKIADVIEVNVNANYEPYKK